MSSEIITLDVAAMIGRHIAHERLDRYYTLLMDENRRINLVSRETGRPDFDRLVAESLLPLDSLSGTFGSYLDIGSGGGMPVVPILLTGRVAGGALIVERTQKRVDALRRMLRGLELAAEFESRTFEELHLSRKFDLITLRYVKLTPPLLKQILAALSENGSFVYYSTPEFTIDHARVRTVRFQSPQDAVVKSVTVVGN